MKKIFLSTVFALFLGASVSATAKIYQPKNIDILHFQTKWLQKELEQNKDKNLVISPVSLYQALALFGHGLNDATLRYALTYPTGGERVIWVSKEKTAENVKEQLLPADQAAFRIRLSDDMLSDGQVKITNSIWGNRFLPEYIFDTKAYLNADANPLPENTRAINEWISEKTQGKISNLLAEDKTNPLDLFLVNTVYFKADWMNKFKKFNTKKMPFFTLNGPVDVDMMFDEKEIDYFENETIQAIRLPYKANQKGVFKKHYMTFILPKEGVEFNEFLSKLEINDFYLRFLENIPVHVYLPKFDLEYQSKDMVQTLKSMGLKSIFEEGAFKGSENTATLKSVIHKSKISVDEAGTEASAVTAMLMGDGGLPFFQLERKQPYFIFKADRPFLFMVDEGLFVGVVNDPTKE